MSVQIAQSGTIAQAAVFNQLVGCIDNTLEQVLGTGIISGLQVAGTGISAGLALIGHLTAGTSQTIDTIPGVAYGATNSIYLVQAPPPTGPTYQLTDPGVFIANQTGIAPVNSVLCCTVTLNSSGAISGYSNLPAGRVNLTLPLSVGGLSFTGPWSSATAYTKYQVVGYGSGTWIALVANTNETPAEGTYWTQLAAQGATGPAGAAGPAGANGLSFTAKGVWISGHSYNLNDVVQGSDGNAYASVIAANAGNNPVGDSGAHWEPFAAQGPAGTAGLGFNFRSAWSNSTTYAVNDVVTYGSALYISILGTNLNNIPGTTGSVYWVVAVPQGATGPTGAPGASLNPLGNWNAGTTYGVLALVSYNGASWISIVAGNTGNPPSTSDTVHWLQNAAQGATGPTGNTGAAGTAATVAVGTVGTGAAGSSAAVTNAGSSTAAVLNFTIPQGNTGPTGPSGGSSLLYVNPSIPGGNTVTNTTTQTLFASSYMLPANTLVAGTVLKFTLSGQFTTDTASTPTLTFALFAGSTQIATSQAIATVVNEAAKTWWMEVELTVQSIGASASLYPTGFAWAGNAAQAGTVYGDTDSGAVVINSTAAQTLQAAITMGAASANNSVRLDMLKIELQGSAGAASGFTPQASTTPNSVQLAVNTAVSPNIAEATPGYGTTVQSPAVRHEWQVAVTATPVTTDFKGPGGTNADTDYWTGDTLVSGQNGVPTLNTGTAQVTFRVRARGDYANGGVLPTATAWVASTTTSFAVPTSSSPTILLDYAFGTGSNLANGTSIPATTWTNVLSAAQSFTITKANAVIFIEIWGGYNIGASSGSLNIGTQLSIDAGSTLKYYAGGAGYYAGTNVFTGAGVYLTGLAVGTHTIMPQVYCQQSGSGYCRTMTYPNLEPFGIRVLQF